MKAYRIAYLRVGEKELWAGWRIAGRSEGVSGNAIDAYKTMQSANSLPEISAALYNRAPVIRELICDVRNVYYSRLTYGIRDFVQRASMRADGLIFSFAENPQLYRNIGDVLFAPDEAFDNHLHIETLYLEMKAKNEDVSAMGTKDITTVLEPYESPKANVPRPSVIAGLSFYRQIIYALYWTLNSKTTSTLYLICDWSDEKKLAFFAELFSYLPFSMRPLVAFRTQPVSSLKPLQFEFVLDRPKIGSFINLKTGESNIFDMLRRFENYEFIRQALALESARERNDYFEKLNRKTVQLGGGESAQLVFLETANMLLQEENSVDGEELSDLELVKKLHTFLQLPLSNNAIDAVCAGLMKEIADRDIVVRQEIVYTKIREKLRVSQCDDYIRYGYMFIAGQLARAEDKQLHYPYVSSLDQDSFSRLEKLLLLTDGGADFLDAYCGEYVCAVTLRLSNEFEHDLKETDSFLVSVSGLPKQIIIKRNAADKYRIIGENLVGHYYEGAVSLVALLPRLFSSVQKHVPEHRKLIEDAVNERFWQSFSFDLFDVGQTNEYRAVANSSHISKTALVILDLFGWLDPRYTPGSELPVKLDNVLRRESEIISEKAVRKIKTQFQETCLSRVGDKSNIDFWYHVASLSGDQTVDFILENDLPVFTYEPIFMMQISSTRKKSEYFKRDENLDLFQEQLREYIAANKKNKDYAELVEDAQRISDAITIEKKNREKLLKEYRKSQKKQIKSMKEPKSDKEAKGEKSSHKAKAPQNAKEAKSGKGIFGRFIK